MFDRKLIDHQLSTFFSRGALSLFERGELILPPYGYAQAVYFIETGYVKVVSPDKGGNQNLLCILGPGDVFPFPGGLNIYKVESYYFAMSHLKARHLSSELLRHVVENNRAISTAIILKLNDLIMDYSNRVYTLSLRTQRERLASLLILLNARFGVEHNQEVILILPITHAEIATAISSSRESVSRLIRRMVNEDLLEQRNHLMVIKNPAKLLSILE